MDDPFAILGHARHPALSERPQIPIDVYYPLVEGFLQDERYQNWALGSRPWQLHCFGKPGCGKTTFAAIVKEELCRVYKDTPVPVIFISIQDDVPNDHTSLIEDLLASIYYQLRRHAPNLDPQSSQLASLFETACRIGEASSRRLNLLRQALQAQLAANKHSFLILDGYDRLGTALRSLLDHELQDSHRHRLSVLITRRTPVYKPPTEEVLGCDGCGTLDLKLYFKCPEPDCLFALCYDCVEKQLKCDQDGHSLSLLEPYPHIDLDITRPNETVRVNGRYHDRSLLESFAAQALEKEYGNLGLHSQTINETMSVIASPSPSNIVLGRRLMSFVMDEPDRNINLARLRLDDVYGMISFADIEEVADRLPRSIISLFDLEIERIRHRSATQYNLGLEAIVAVAGYRNDLGMPLQNLQQQICKENPKDDYCPPPRSLDDILLASNGLLVVQPQNDVVRVALYHTAFASYVRDDYSEALFHAKRRLYQNIQQTQESIQAKQGNQWNIAHMTASPPTMSQDFKNPLDNPSRTSSNDSTYYSRKSSLNTNVATATTSRTSMNSHTFPIAEERGTFDDARTWPLSKPSLGTNQLGISFGNVLDTALKSEGSHRHEKLGSVLCAFCTDVILGSGNSNGDHYSSFKALRAAEIKQCTFCSALYQHILDQSNDEQSESLKWPLYSWAVRSSGRLGNKKGSIAVSLGPIEYSCDSITTGTKLPTKKFHLFPETEIGHIATDADLGNSTRPHTSGDSQLKRWVDKCVANHSGCRKELDDTFVPTRLLDLNLPDQNFIRVVETRPNNIKGPYLTLSHCWGKAWLLTLTRKEEARLKGPGAHLNELPKNFQETIEVARFIGLRYIWIDSLCICQGEGGDFATEGQLMHKVYRYSYCNIAIADSSDSRGGIFRDRDPQTIIPAKVTTDASSKLGEGTWRILPSDLWTSSLLDSKIYTRGWVFQERMLSPRILHFANSQVFWDCCTLSATETLPSGLPHALDALASTDRHWRGRIQSVTYPQSTPVVGAKDDSMEKFWKTSGANYTACDLTNQVDKTFAIWSIAKLVRDVLDEEYGAGLWEFGLEEQLAWRVKECKQDMRLVELGMWWPSWTWASVKGAVASHDRILSRKRTYTVLNHAGGPIAFSITKDKSNQARGEARNNEPLLLESKSLEMVGYLGHGELMAGQSPGTYSLILSMSTTEPQPIPSEIDVFLDEVPPVPNSCTFVILAASEHRPVRPKIPTPVNSSSSNISRPKLPASTSSASVVSMRSMVPTPKSPERSIEAVFNRPIMPKIPTQSQEIPSAIARRPTLPKSLSSEDAITPRAEEVKATYSGIGLLLVLHSDYLMQQRERLLALRKLVSDWPKGKPDPPHPSDKKLVGRLADLEKWVKELENRTTRYGEDLHYHRVGALQFQDVGAGTWEAMKGDGKVKFWLD